MSLSKRWSKYNKVQVSTESNNLGVYEIGNNAGEILYIGEGQVKARLLDHFPQGDGAVVGASQYRCEYTNSKLKAVQRQNAEIEKFIDANGRLPKYNQKKSASVPKKKSK